MVHTIINRALTHRNPIAQWKSNSLRFTPNPDMSNDRPCFCFFYAQVGKGIFACDLFFQRVLSDEKLITSISRQGRTEQTSCIHICRKEVAVARHGTFWCQTWHVGRFHNMLQVLPGLTSPQKQLACENGGRKWKKTYVILVETFTRFSHSNSVHMFLN